MRFWSAFVGVLLLLSAPAKAAGDLHIVDVTGEFDRFVMATADMPDAQRVRAFEKQIGPLADGFYARDRNPEGYDFRVLLPLLMPAIVASAAVVFAISIDDFVISQWLSSGGETDTVPVKIYSATRAAPLPSTNAIASIMMVLTLASITLGFLVWRAFTRGERRAGQSVVKDMGALEI